VLGVNGGLPLRAGSLAGKQGVEQHGGPRASAAGDQDRGGEIVGREVAEQAGGITGSNPVASTVLPTGLTVGRSRRSLRV
jgi:hypothetical protein